MKPFRAFVLLSGGLDSTTALYIAAANHGVENVEAIGIDYGQRHVRELRAAREICEQLGVPHTILQLGPQHDTMLTNASIEIPSVSYAEIEGVSPTYVPFRNGQMLSRIAAYAHNWSMKSEEGLYGAGPEYAADREANPSEGAIYFGAHAEDALNWAYPDCTPEFVGAMANAIYIGTYHRIRLITPFIHSSKAEIILAGMRLQDHHPSYFRVPYEKTWSCYKGEDIHCGGCPTCRARQQAFADACEDDPTAYAALPGVIDDKEVPF